MVPTAQSLALTEFSPTHLDGAVQLSRQVGWPHQREDWALVLRLSRGVAAVEEGRVVGTAFATPFGESLAAVNMIIVDEAMRGRGLGRRLMEVVMGYVDGREMRLVSTAIGLPLYEKLGFQIAGHIQQYQGPIAPVARPEGVELADPEQRDRITALDATAFGGPRKALIEALFELGQIAVLRRNGGIAGYAALRAFGRGEVIGPVVAGNADEAKQLIQFHMARRPGAFLRIDVPEESGLGLWLERYGLARAGGGTTMRRAPLLSPSPVPRTLFALANQALG